ncbi:unnamed protein product [Oikopleura dioica]|uniref:Uncharacterized protein n=1 Tax=Oikopleura dioica TaxID=34765 RepID=E4XVC3_OIKDI|nr:unnamed protein product [Oikopleura dioica]
MSEDSVDKGKIAVRSVRRKTFEVEVFYLQVKDQVLQRQFLRHQAQLRLGEHRLL